MTTLTIENEETLRKAARLIQGGQPVDVEEIVFQAMFVCATRSPGAGIEGFKSWLRAFTSLGEIILSVAKRETRRG